MPAFIAPYLPPPTPQGRPFGRAEACPQLARAQVEDLAAALRDLRARGAEPTDPAALTAALAGYGFGRDEVRAYLPLARRQSRSRMTDDG